MTIKKTQEDGTIIIAVAGRLDTTTALDFQTELLAALNETDKVRVNFDELDYISSAGLRVLLTAEKEAKKIGCEMCIYNISDDVMEVFDLIGFTDILTIERA